MDVFFCWIKCRILLGTKKLLELRTGYSHTRRSKVEAVIFRGGRACLWSGSIRFASDVRALLGPSSLFDSYVALGTNRARR